MPVPPPPLPPPDGPLPVRARAGDFCPGHRQDDQPGV